MNADTAYENWKKSHKMDLRVYTDQQLFEIGFNASRGVIAEMEHVINEMERENHKLKAEIKKLRKTQNEPV